MYLFIVSRAILNFQIDMEKRTPSLYTTRYLTFIFTWQVAAWPNFYTPEREVCLPSHWIATMVPHRYWTGRLRNDPGWNSFYTDDIVFFLTILTAGQQLAVMEQLTCAARESCTKVSSGLYVSILWRLFTWAFCSRGTLFSWNLKESINTAWFRRTLSRHWYNVEGVIVHNTCMYIINVYS